MSCSRGGHIATDQFVLNRRRLGAEAGVTKAHMFENSARSKILSRRMCNNASRASILECVLDEFAHQLSCIAVALPILVYGIADFDLSGFIDPPRENLDAEVHTIHTIQPRQHHLGSIVRESIFGPLHHILLAASLAELEFQVKCPAAPVKRARLEDGLLWQRQERVVS